MAPSFQDAPADPGARRRLGIGATGPGATPGRLEQPANKRLKVDSTPLSVNKPILFEHEEDQPTTQISRGSKPSRGKGLGDAFDDEDENDSERRAAEKAAKKPSLILQNLPMTISEDRIRNLLPQTLKIDAVRLSSSPSTRGTLGPSERPTQSAIVTLGSETPARDIESVVTSLQNSYIGLGCYLTIFRHLSSAALGSKLPETPSIYATKKSLPFDAESIRVDHRSEISLNRVPPPAELDSDFRRPPPNAQRNDQPRWPDDYRVHVRAPSSAKLLRLIHMMVDKVVRLGSKFEATFMAKPQVQEDEKWAWLFDRRSQAGVYYLWRLWQVSSGQYVRSGLNSSSRVAPPEHRIFEDMPKFVDHVDLPYEFVIKFDDFAKDPAYDSSDEEDINAKIAEDNKRNQHSSAHDRSLYAHDDTQAPNYLSPLRRAQLAHLIARLPDTIGKLTRGNLARITAFACRHAYAAEEIVEMVTINVLKPLCYSDWATGKVRENESGNGDTFQHSEMDRGIGANTQNHEEHDTGRTSEQQPSLKESDPFGGKPDQSSAKLVALYIINDVLSGPPATGVPGAWKFRGLFENYLVNYQVFEHLGRLDKEYGWGRIKAEKWQRSVKSILDLWEGYSMFDKNIHQQLVQSFYYPPLTNEEQATEEMKPREKGVPEQKTSRWKAVEKKKEGGKIDTPDERSRGKETQSVNKPPSAGTGTQPEVNNNGKNSMQQTTDQYSPPAPAGQGRRPRAEDWF